MRTQQALNVSAATAADSTAIEAPGPPYTPRKSPYAETFNFVPTLTSSRAIRAAAWDFWASRPFLAAMNASASAGLLIAWGRFVEIGESAMG